MKLGRNRSHFDLPNKSWPPPPTSQHQSPKVEKPKLAISTALGIVSLFLAFLGEISATFLANTISIYGQNWYESMHIFRIMGGILFLIALLIGLLGWRSWAGKIGVCISLVFLLATIEAYQVTGA